MVKFTLKTKKTARQITVEKPTIFKKNNFVVFARIWTLADTGIARLAFDGQAAPLTITSKSVVGMIGGVHLVSDKNSEDKAEINNYFKIFFDHVIYQV